MLRPLTVGHFAPVLRRSAAPGRRELLRSPAFENNASIAARSSGCGGMPRRARAVLPVSMAQKRNSSAAAAAPAAPAKAAPAAPAQKREAVGPTFQEAVQRLQEYWASVGCAVWLPHNTEVSAIRQSDSQE